jgi:hypothetical protein
LLECLDGDLKQNNKPAFLKISAVTDYENFESPTAADISTTVKLNSVVPKLAKNEGDTGSVTNEFFILYSAFGVGGNTATVYPKVFMLCDSSKNELAKVTIAKDDSLAIDPTQMNYSLLIDWSISFKNPDPVVEAVEVT